jgi:2-hydroxy-6-oxo-6-(2'-aminophenyl)hexa-2,4-dienoate hydrolase
MTEYQSRYVEAGGIRTHYIEEGVGDPVILVHGGGAGADGFANWMETLPLLAPHFRTIAVDMVGFGRTAKPAAGFAYSQPARNRHLAAFIEALGLTRPDIVGNSMGGATAIGVAVERPDLVGRLVLMGSAGLNVRISEALRPVIGYDFTREGMVLLMRTLTTEAYRIDDALVDYRFKGAMEPETRRAYAGTMQWIREQGGLFYDEAFIARVAAPTLVVNGKHDKVVPIEHALRFLDLIPRSWGYIIPDCGHWAMLEHPKDFARMTHAFLGRPQ